MRQTKPVRRRKKRRSRLDILRNIAIVVFVVSATALILQRENDMGSRPFSTYYKYRACVRGASNRQFRPCT